MSRESEENRVVIKLPQAWGNLLINVWCAGGLAPVKIAHRAEPEYRDGQWVMDIVFMPVDGPRLHEPDKAG